MEKYCSSCGAKIREDGNFCEGCGKKIIKVEDEKKVTPDFEKKIIDKNEKKVVKKHFKKDLIKYVLIISTVLCVISIMVPWGTLQEKSNLYYNGVEINFYIWGIQSSNSSLKTEWGFLINPTSLLNVFTYDEIKEIPIPLAIWFATFFISIMIVILGFFGIVFIENIQKNNCHTVAGGLAILSLIFFFIFINFGLFSSKLGLTLKSNFNWSFGFFLMLLSAILFFVTFFVDKYFLKSEKVQDSKTVEK